MQRNQLIGAGLIGVGVVALGAMCLSIKHTPKPVVVAQAAPATAVQQVAPSMAIGWRHFQCRRGGQVINDFTQARAVFVGRSYGRVYWKVYTPQRNTDSLAITFNINPDRIVCSYVG